METFQNENENEQSGLDIGQIIRYMLRRIWIVIFTGVFFGLCALIITKMITTPTYTSSTKMYILEKDETSEGISGGNLQLGAAIARDYAQLIKDRQVAESVIAELGLQCTPETLISNISVNIPDEGRIMTISVTDTDPYMASKIATAVRDAAAVHIKEVMNSDAINVVEEATIPIGQAMYNYTRNGILGVALGVIVSIGIILLMYIMNDSIKTAADVERYLGISVLGTIPVMETEETRRRRKEKENENG